MPKKAEIGERSDDWRRDLYVEIFNSSTDAILIDDTIHARVIDCNTRAVEMYGFDSKEELKSQHIRTLSADLPEYSDEVIHEMIQMTIKKGHHCFEWQAKKKDGSTFWVEVNLNTPNSGQEGWVIAVVRDISERKASQQALKLSKERFHAVVEHSQEALVIIDENYCFTYANPSACEIFGRQLDEMIGFDFREGLDKESLELVSTRYKERQAGKEVPSHYEFNIVRKNGEVRHVEMISNIHKDESGQVRTFSQLLDITEKVKANKALEDTQESLLDILETTQDGISLSDYDGEVLFVNTNLCSLLGVNKEDLIGKSAYELARLILKDEDYRKFSKQISLLVSGKLIDPFEIKLNNKIIEIRANLNTKTKRTTAIFVDITERKKTELALIEDEEKFRLLVTQMSQGIAVHEGIFDEKGKMVDYRFLEVNAAFEKMTGLTREALIGKTVLEVLPGTELYWINEYAEVVKSGKPKHIEHYSAELGKYYEVLAYRNREGQFAAITIDVSEHKKTKEELKQASDNWNRTFDSIRDGIALLDADQSIILSNAAFRKLVGKEYENLNGHKCYPLVHQTECVHEDCPFVRMQTSKQRESTEMLVKGKMIEVTVDPILDQEGELKGAVHIIADISSRIQEERVRRIQYNIAHSFSTTESLESLLNRVKVELQEIIDTSNFFVAFYDETTENLRSTLFHDEKDSYQEWPVKGTFSGFVIQNERSLLLKKNDIQVMARKEGLDVTGSLPECWLGVPLKVRGSIVGVIVVQHYKNAKAYNKLSQEILETIANQLGVYIEKKQHELELVKAKERAEESDRLKSAFLTNMSHEIRTPMNGILGFIDLLQNPGLSSQQQDVYFDVVRKSSRRLLETINDIIEISKIESGQMDFNESTIQLDEITDYLVNFFKPEAAEKGLELRLSKSKNKLKNIRTDRIKLESILTNYLKNAIKFTNEGFIELKYFVKDDFLRFEVRDTGIGIPQDKIEDIFERFVQADMRTSRAYEGSGLGLSIAKAYAEILKGNVGLSSEEGKGSVFFLEIPLIEVQVGSKETKREAQRDTSSKESDVMTILVTEDDDTSYYYLEVILASEGYKVYRAANGREAIEQFRAHPEVSIILMDLKMPIMDGFTATRKIREFNKEVFIIAQTAYAFSGDRDRALQAGCNDYISKPIEKDEMKAKIEQYAKKLNK